MNVRARLFAPLSLVTFAAACFAACGGPPSPEDSGSLGDKTFAGQNRCNPKNHERPFIIEWDATDQASFQAAAASDVIFVKYEGCDLKVLDGCREDNAKGQYGAYKPIEWTSGGLEVIDIKDEGELYAKLPLGAATLGGKVSSGEKLHMEYYVSGNRSATRDKVFRSELAANPKCAGATHFVYGYNLGAFAIANAKNLKGEVHGSYLGFGAGGSKSTDTATEKRGGDLASCKGETAKEVESCKVPVRLTLRELEDGENPDKAAGKGPVSDAALNAVGALQASSDAEKKAAAVLQSAETKKQSGDGKGCIADLDEHDRLDPRPGGLSTNPASGKVAGTRAECLMLSGQCDAGKVAFRKALEATKSGEIGPDHMDNIVQAEAGIYCRGGKMSEQDQYVAALTALRDGGFGVKKKTLAECQSAFDTAMKLYPKFPGAPPPSSLPQKPLVSLGHQAANCMAKAGDCAAAFKAFKAVNDAKSTKDDGFKFKDDQATRVGFDGVVAECKGK
jgi:hypothetical protein